MNHPRGLPPHVAALDRPIVMGVLNVTSDSFSDGGLHLDPRVAIAHGRALIELGADIVDIGGESTRPGAERVSEEVERARVLTVVAELAAAGVAVSIDTMRASVARAAVHEGACLVNDVSGGLADPEMLATLAELEVPVVLMHWRGHSAGMQGLATYADPAVEVAEELRSRLEAAVAAGIARERIVLDPGIGFAKESDHNWAVLHGLSETMALGCPVLVGASRKRFLGALLADPDGTQRAMDDRDLATLGVTAICAREGVWGVRVHDVRGARDAVLVGRAWRSGHA